MLECPEDAWDKIFEINVKVSFLLFKECVPHMKVKNIKPLCSSIECYICRKEVEGQLYLSAPSVVTSPSPPWVPIL